MRYDSRTEVGSEVESILKKHVADHRRLVDRLVELVLKAYEEGEYDGKKRERRNHE